MIQVFICCVTAIAFEITPAIFFSYVSLIQRWRSCRILGV